MNGKLVKDLTQGRVLPLLLGFAYPIMLSNMLQTAYNMVDMIVVGKYVGSAGLSAVSIGGDVMHFFSFLGMGFATAGQIIVSQYIGAGKKRELNGVIGTLFTCVIGLGAVLSVLGVICTGMFVSLLNVPPESQEGAYSYIMCCSAGMIFIFGYNMVSAVLRGMGDSKRPMIFIGLAAVINTVLDLLFVAVFEMGAFGAALATVIGQGASFLLSLAYLYKNKEAFMFDFRSKSFVPDRGVAKLILKLGIPIAIQSTAGNISTLFVGSYVNTYGVAASAVTGVGHKLNSIALIVANSMNVASAAMIGQCFGAGKTDRIKKVFYTVFIVDLIFVTALSAVILAFPRQVFGIFDSSEQVLEMAGLYAPVAAISFMGFAVRSPSLGLINGLGQSKMNFAMGIVEGFVLRIGLTYLMGVVLNMGISGFWYGSAIASYGYGIVVFPYFFSGKWKDRRPAIAV